MQAATRPSLMWKRMAFKVAVVLQVGQVTANLCRCLAFHMLMILALILAVSIQVLTVAVEQWTTIPPRCGRVILTIQCQDQACFEGQFDRRVVESSG